MSYLPNDLSTDVIVQLARVQQNDAALDTAISGNLTEANLNSATRIPSGSAGGPTMLANDDVEETIVLRWGGTTGTAFTTAGGQPIDCVALPVAGTYTIQSAAYSYFSLAGAGTAGSIRVDIGTVAAGAFSSSSNVITSVALANNTGASQTIAGTLAVAVSSFTATSATNIALSCTVNSVTTTPRLAVTLVLTRSLR